MIKFIIVLMTFSLGFLAYPFEHDVPFKTWRQLAIGDGRDIVIPKAYTTGRRAQACDYLDIHEALTSSVLSLKSLIRTRKTYLWRKILRTAYLPGSIECLKNGSIILDTLYQLRSKHRNVQ